MSDGAELAVQQDAYVSHGMNLPSDEEITKMFRLADAFYQSGIYRDIKQAQQAFAKLVIGRDLGFSVSQSMQGVQFVQGQIQIHYSLLGLTIRSRGFTWETVERSETRACARFTAPDGEDRGEVEFTFANAEQAGLTKASRSGEPSMYTKYPRNMLWARMMSDAVRFAIQEATGGIPVYVPGEIIPVAELTEGEGTGEERGIDLPESVLGVIDRATKLGHQGWAERSVWEYRMDRGDEIVAASVQEATLELDALADQHVSEAAREAGEAAIQEAEVVPEEPGEAVPDPPARDPDVDLPVADADLPEPTGSMGQSEAREALGFPPLERDPSPEAAVPDEVPKQKAPQAAKAAKQEREEPEVDIEVLRRRLAQVQKKEAKTEVDKKLRDEEIEWIESELMKAAEQEADEDPDQGSLL